MEQTKVWIFILDFGADYTEQTWPGQYSVFTAFLDDGDEVIMFEPFFDQYLPSVTFNGGKPVYVPLHPPKDAQGKTTSADWTIDLDELRCVVFSNDNRD